MCHFFTSLVRGIIKHSNLCLKFFVRMFCVGINSRRVYFIWGSKRLLPNGLNSKAMLMYPYLGLHLILVRTAIKPDSGLFYALF